MYTRRLKSYNAISDSMARNTILKKFKILTLPTLKEKGGPLGSLILIS